MIGSQITKFTIILCHENLELYGNPSRYSDPNKTLIFLAEHMLDMKLIISNSDILRLSSNGSLPTNITCHGSGSLEFTNISQIQITALKFTGCSSRVEYVHLFILKDSSFLGKNGISGSALHMINVLDAEIEGSFFIANTVGTYQRHVKYLESLNNFLSWVDIQTYNASIGGAVVVTSSRVYINSSHFKVILHN